jgi:hypothetical protein
MMRKPIDDPYVWYRLALKGLNPPIDGDDPQSGWYWTRIVKGGPKVGVKIWLEQDVDETGELINPPVLKASKGDKFVNPFHIWTYVADNVIEEAEYNFLMAKAEYARTVDTSLPEARPDQKVDRRSIPKLFGR